MGNKISWASLDNTNSINLIDNKNNTHTINSSTESFDFLAPTIFDKTYEFNSWEVEGFNESDNTHSNGYLIFKNSVLNYKSGYISEVTVYFESEGYSNNNINKIIVAKHIGNEMTILAHGICVDNTSEKKVFKINENHYKNTKLDSSFCADSKNAISFIFTSRDFNTFPEWQVGATVIDTELCKLMSAGYGSDLIEEVPPEKVLPIIYISRSQFDESSQQFIHNNGNTALVDKFGALKYSLKINCTLVENIDEHIFKDFREYHLTNTYKAKIKDLEDRVSASSFETPILPLSDNIKNRCFSRIYLSHNTLSFNNLIDIYNKKVNLIRIPINISDAWEDGHLAQWNSYIKDDIFELSLSFSKNPYVYDPFWTESVPLTKIVDENNITFEADFSNTQIVYPDRGILDAGDSEQSGIWLKIINKSKENDFTKQQIICKSFTDIQKSEEDRIYLHSLYNTNEKEIFVPLTAAIKVYFDIDGKNELIENLYQKTLEQEKQIEILDSSVKKLLPNTDSYEISANANDNYQLCRCVLRGVDSPNTYIIKDNYEGNYYLKSIKFIVNGTHYKNDDDYDKSVYLAINLNGKNYYSTNSITLCGTLVSPEWIFNIKDAIILDGSDLELALITEIPEDKDTNIANLVSANYRLTARVLNYNKLNPPGEAPETSVHRPGGYDGYYTPRIMFTFNYGKIYDLVFEICI